MHGTGTSKLLIIIGAGAAAELVIREINKPGSGYAVVCCLDDDVSKTGIRVQGVKVEGTVGSLPDMLREHTVNEVWIAAPSASKDQMNRFVSICSDAGVCYKTLPSWREMIGVSDVIHQIREVNVDDLLGRDQVSLNLEMVREQIEGRVVMVTGAAGSIGSELCAQLLDYNPRLLICLDQNENGSFYLQLNQQKHRNASKAIYCVADISNRIRVRSILLEYNVQVIFHAAAYKHVPMMETNVQEAVQNNIFSLIEFLSIAEDSGCESFVMISSDKAVNPTNVMGTTKRIGELILSSRPTQTMRCVSVRFGNVLGSSGSVVPLLKEQIRTRGELLITHPEIKRFFMTTKEAVSLVLQAFTVGEHGDLLVLDMGDPVSIVELGRTLIRLSGKSEKEIPIRFTGLRQGEKLKEEMFYETEQIWPTSCEKIKRTRSKMHGWQYLKVLLEELEIANTTENVELIKARMNRIVPEYQYEEIETLPSPEVQHGRSILRQAFAAVDDNASHFEKLRGER
jgi:FlaA1/EpsC-like NDP-sugar epimerase